MSHIDTLKTFDDLVASGVSEDQARAHINILDKSFNGVATKDDLLLLEKDIIKEISLLKLYIFGIGTICAIPIIQGLFMQVVDYIKS